MSESESETDSDNEKNIVVRHLGVRDPLRNTVTLAGEMRDTKPPSRDIAPPNIVHVNPTSIVRTSSDDSTSSNISIREEDVHILLRSIPEYKQYDTADSRRNDSYLRSALRSMPESLLDYSDEYGNTLLLIAAQYSCFDLVKLLLKRGASPHVINTSGASCLHFACYRDSLSIPIVELLLEHNVSVNIAETLYGCTPLHYAASTGELALCQLLIQRGAYIHAHDFDNCSSIDYAVDAGMMEVADYLTREMSASHTAQPAVNHHQ